MRRGKKIGHLVQISCFMLKELGEVLVSFKRSIEKIRYLCLGADEDLLGNK